MVVQVLRALYLGREVALKVAGEYNKAVTPRQEREAEQELNILRQLQHRCVVRVSPLLQAVTHKLTHQAASPNSFVLGICSQCKGLQAQP